MLLDKVKKYYSKDYDLNCAETMLYAANEEYNLNLHTETFKTMAAFGGGMAIEDICGAITGSIAVIGIIFTEKKAHKSPKVKELTKEFIEKFNKELKENKCDKLKAKYKDNGKERCLHMMEISAEILSDIINRENNIR
ncbi:C-GCAxxG-C-C family (seleno)protein [Clostridium fallax]|uniref:C_GCAxxG_C_C family probable redox protein n=1 Tax=Clostridium fallax TaxID=1533 RepID=A0A1M4Z4D3_9CLOT|nr:C-GCAxxG-C-C family (seleno)protein [Clostridium fallax]SHF12647.1 C_GCAxxG_C_C family probable redox protein [Clostridium fallax]SQB22302.1 C_GCAxxG_C_C family probable redox protein [Clostridium fallax]